MGLLLNGGEKFLFDDRNVEILRLTGVDDCVLWHFIAYPTAELIAALPPDAQAYIPLDSVSGGVIDCLYDEPMSGSKHYAPFKVLGYYEEPTLTDTVADSGSDFVFEGRMWFSRKNLEDAQIPPEPVHNDLVQVGDIAQIFKAGRYFYFEIRNITRTGWVHDSQEFTQYVCDVVRNDSFVPERKILGGA